MTQEKLPEGKSRLSVRIRGDVKRLAKIKALQQDMALEVVVDKLLAAWVAGKIVVNGDGGQQQAVKK